VLWVQICKSVLLEGREEGRGQQYLNHKGRWCDWQLLLLQCLLVGWAVSCLLSMLAVVVNVEKRWKRRRSLSERAAVVQASASSL
jgi:hypothetical protein